MYIPKICTQYKRLYSRCGPYCGQGCRKNKKNHFNLVLLDMRLPDYDGIKVLEKIKEISPDTEVVILTAYADIKSVIEAMEKNAFSYLPKPFEIPHLISILEKAYEKQTLSLLNRDLFQKYRMRRKIGKQHLIPSQI